MTTRPTLRDVRWYAERDGRPGMLPIRVEMMDLENAQRALVRDFYALLLTEVRDGRMDARLFERIEWEVIDEGVRWRGGGRLPLRWRAPQPGYDER